MPGLRARTETVYHRSFAGIPRVYADVGDLGFPGGFGKYFVRSRSCLGGMGTRHGTAASALFRGRRRGGTSDTRSRSAAAYRTALIEPADPRPGSRSRRPTADPRPAWDRADSGRSGVSRPCAAGALSSRSGRRSGAPGRLSGQGVLRHWVPHRNRVGMVARSRTDPARRIAQHRNRHLQPDLAGTRTLCCGEKSTRLFCVPCNRCRTLCSSH